MEQTLLRDVHTHYLGGGEVNWGGEYMIKT